MAYLDDLLGQGEQVVFEAHQHWFLLVARILTEMVLLVLLVATVILSRQAFPDLTPNVQMIGLLLASVVGVIAIASAVLDFLHWRHDRYLVTDRRVMQLKGVFNKSVLDSSLEKINDVALRQSLFGRIFNYGDIEILTASEEAINRMDKIANPLQFKRAMIDARTRYDRYLDPTPLTAYDTTPVAPTLQDILGQLATLHRQGILTTTEFEDKKRELLSRM